MTIVSEMTHDSSFSCDIDSKEVNPISSTLAEGPKPKREPIQFKSEPPTLVEAKKSTTILPSGMFARKHQMIFTNWKRHVQKQEKYNNEGREEDEEEEPKSYIGMEFRHRDFQSDIGEYSRYPSRRERKYDSISYPYMEILNAHEANEMLREKANFEENVPKAFRNQNQWATPESTIWKQLGKHKEYIPNSFVCPQHRELNHPVFTSEQKTAEKNRINLVYELVCQQGMVHVEDLWKVYINRNKVEEHPFDGFDHFYSFIRDRSHVFGMDKSRMVYNQNLLITVAVLRYVHSLEHGIAVENTPRLFKEERSRLFYRAFLGFMSKEDLSFDRFFENFPSLFTFNDVWSLNPEARTIPCAFETDCLPKRCTSGLYADKSQQFTGIGKIIGAVINTAYGFKLESEENLRKDMSYLVQVPITVIDNPAKYKVGMRVAYTGYRIYNGERASVHATHIQLVEEELASDGTVDCWTFDENEADNGPMVEQTVSSEVRIIDSRETVASMEKGRNSVMLKAMAEGSVELSVLWKHVKDLFENCFESFIDFVGKRPWYYIPCQMDGNFFVTPRSSDSKWAMIELITQLSGAEGISGSSWQKEEAAKLCTVKNESLNGKDRFTLEDLDQVLFTRKGMRIDGNGKYKMERTVTPLVRWNRDHRLLMQI